jgi:hypothetical protein
MRANRTGRRNKSILRPDPASEDPKLRPLRFRIVNCGLRIDLEPGTSNVKSRPDPRLIHTWQTFRHFGNSRNVEVSQTRAQTRLLHERGLFLLSIFGSSHLVYGYTAGCSAASRARSRQKSHPPLALELRCITWNGTLAELTALQRCTR